MFCDRQVKRLLLPGLVDCGAGAAAKQLVREPHFLQTRFDVRCSPVTPFRAGPGTTIICPFLRARGIARTKEGYTTGSHDAVVEAIHESRHETRNQ